jgi:signal transduction histidine kinase
MLRTLMLCAAASVAIGLAHPTFAQGQFGTAAEAKAMLEKAVAAVKADKTKALDQIQKGEGGFKDRDLYAFCANASDGVITAHPALKGKNIREIKDKNGKALGEEMMTVAKEGKFDEVSYMWPRPGADTTPVQKVSYVTKAGDQVCGVGYYK